MQHHTYPLPPLYLTEIIERAKADHTHRCDEACRDSSWSVDFCERMRQENKGLLDTPVIVKIEEGHGRHECDKECELRSTARGYKCMRSCDDSDWIVELCYHERGWHAVYGVKRHGDIQNVSLWMD